MCSRADAPPYDGAPSQQTGDPHARVTCTYAVGYAVQHPCGRTAVARWTHLSRPAIVTLACQDHDDKIHAHVERTGGYARSPYLREDIS